MLVIRLNVGHSVCCGHQDDFSFEYLNHKIRITECFLASILGTNALPRINILYIFPLISVSIPFEISAGQSAVIVNNIKASALSLCNNVNLLMVAQITRDVAACQAAYLQQTPSHEPLWFRTPVNDLHRKKTSVTVSSGYFDWSDVEMVLERKLPLEWKLSEFMSPLYIHSGLFQPSLQPLRHFPPIPLHNRLFSWISWWIVYCHHNDYRCPQETIRQPQEVAVFTSVK